MLDYFDVLGMLSTEERQVQASARDFLEAEVLPDISGNWEAGKFPRELVNRSSRCRPCQGVPAVRSSSQLEETAHEIRTPGGRATTVQLFASDSNQVDMMVEQTADELVQIDILANSAGAGRGGAAAPLPDGASKSRMGDETWRDVFDTKPKRRPEDGAR